MRLARHTQNDLMLLVVDMSMCSGIQAYWSEEPQLQLNHAEEDMLMCSDIQNLKLADTLKYWDIQNLKLADTLKYWDIQNLKLADTLKY